MNLSELIESVSSQLDEADLFYGHGTDNPLDEACYLIASIVGYQVVYEEFKPDHEISTTQQQQIDDLLEQRIKTRKPTAYLVNLAWFAGMDFYVDERVLIPRSPIAELIQQQFQPWLQPDKVKRILDIGTGSACIAIACAYHFPEASVDAVDIDKDAITVANNNISRHDLQARVTAIQSNLFDNIDSKQYQLIIANPPYVDQEEVSGLPAEYHHEPLSALQSDDEGLQCSLQILSQAADYLAEEGHLILEVGYTWPVLVERCPEVPFFWFEFEHGGEGVCMLSKSQLREWF